MIMSLCGVLWVIHQGRPVTRAEGSPERSGQRRANGRLQRLRTTGLAGSRAGRGRVAKLRSLEEKEEEGAELCIWWSFGELWI